MSRTRTSITELQTQRDNAQEELNRRVKLIETHNPATYQGPHALRRRRVGDYLDAEATRLANKLARLDAQIAATIDEPHEATGTHDDPVRYTHNASTPEGRRRENKANWDAADKDAKAGKVLCLSDLICSAEAVHIDQNKEGK